MDGLARKKVSKTILSNSMIYFSYLNNLSTLLGMINETISLFEQYK